MNIANPIYDVVFKFMLEDEEVAKSFLSAIIEEEVLEVHFAAQERTLRRPLNKVAEKEDAEDKEKLFLTVCRFDFSAQIATPNGGHKTVMIELQKAKFSSDIMRFRRYLGLHYQNPDNTYGSDNHPKARQIYCIFLLGYDIGIRDCPIIQVDQNIKDGTTKKYLEVTNNEFIEGLHHRSWIVQSDQLKEPYRNDVEKLLSIFGLDDHTVVRHTLQVDENDFPERYVPIIRRLRMASESADVQAEMEMEDDFMEEIQAKERTIAEQSKTIKEDKKALKAKDKKALKAKDKTIKAKDKTIEEDKKALKAKDKTIEKDKKALEEKNKTIEEKDKLIKELKEQLAKSQI
ncbi:MAG: hypothetical protein LBK82_00480 [Planctomycetaceae bacterium]|jgi:hypothetical protein|nr:hypothetical protein [Planctomycetaceae bacterium]